MRYLDRLANPDDTPLAWLTQHLTDADHFHAHTGYLDRAGVRLIETPLRDLLERGGQAHIVVDHRDGNPRRADIAWLVDLLAPCGLHPGHLVLIAARTSVGKSALAGDFLRAAALRNGVPSLLLSFEMTQEEIAERVVSATARVPLHVLRARKLNEDDWKRIARVAGEIADAPLYVNDSCSPSIRHIAEEIRRMVRDHGVRLVVVDYIQQLSADRRVENKQQEITEIARAFKRLALELHIPIVVVSQLNRGPEMRPDKRPLLSDLRDSGTLEEAADVVILLHRDDYWDKESPRSGEADLIVAKHRNGPTDTIIVASQLHLSRFVDMAIG